MYMPSLQRFTTPVFTLLVACLIPAISFATTINLRDAPTDQAKITGTIELSTGIIPIFTPKDGGWVKVADPKNGNTGWVKNSELKDSKGNVISFSQTVSDTGEGGKSIQMMQSNGQTITPEQKKALEEQLVQQQREAQQSILQVQHNAIQMLDTLNKMYQQQLEYMKKNPGPVMPQLLPAINKPAKQQQ